MMNCEQMIERLLSLLLRLGFPAYLERELRVHICMQPAQFTLSFREQWQDDEVQVTVYFKREESSEMYQCCFYEANLFKGVSIPPASIDGVDVKELESRMNAIDWQTLASKGTEEPDTSFREIEDIIRLLQSLSTSEDGKEAAGLLKIKYWKGTPLEVYCPRPGRLKGIHAVTQRFYLFEGQQGITLDEAYRFLCHRLRERSLYAQKKSTREDVFSPGENAVNGSKTGRVQGKRQVARSHKRRI